MKDRIDAVLNAALISAMFHEQRPILFYAKVEYMYSVGATNGFFMFPVNAKFLCRRGSFDPSAAYARYLETICFFFQKIETKQSKKKLSSCIVFDLRQNVPRLSRK